MKDSNLKKYLSYFSFFAVILEVLISYLFDLFKKYLPYVAVVVVILVGSASYFLWHVYHQPTADQVLQQKLEALYKTEGVPAVQQGTDPYNYGLDASTTVATTSTSSLGVLVFTGKDTKILPQASVYYLNLDTQEVYVPKFLQRNGLFVFAGFLARTNPVGMFLDSISSASSKNTQSQLGVHYYSFAKDQFNYIRSTDGPTEARSLQWSQSAGLLALSRMQKPYTTVDETGSIANWEVMITDPTKTSPTKVITGAANPRWSPDGSELMYVRDDGLYLYDLATDQEKKVEAMTNGKVISTTMFDVSPDGRYLAWTVTHVGLIVMNEITNWNYDQFVMKEIGRITVPNTDILWPQFSPDSLHYAVQAIDSAQPGTTERKNPRFEIRKTLGRDVVLSYPTNDFIFTEFNTDTWINKDTSPEDATSTATTSVASVATTTKKSN